MSRTIKTKSGSNFWTNINSEHMLGHLCQECGSKHYEDEFTTIMGFPKFAYSMTEEEATETSKRLKILSEKAEDIFPRYRHFLGKEVTPISFKKIILDYAEIFEVSKGYECL